MGRLRHIDIASEVRSRRTKLGPPASSSLLRRGVKHGHLLRMWYMAAISGFQVTDPY